LTYHDNVFRAQIQVFVYGLFELNTDFNKFKAHLRDFLIQLKVRQSSPVSHKLNAQNTVSALMLAIVRRFQQFSGDNADLFLEEREAEIELAQKRETEAAMKIPGMIPPLKLPTMDGTSVASSSFYLALFLADRPI